MKAVPGFLAGALWGFVRVPSIVEVISCFTQGFRGLRLCFVLSKIKQTSEKFQVSQKWFHIFLSALSL